MAISTSLPINLTTIITEVGLSVPQSILTCKAAYNPCGVNAIYWLNNGNSLTDWRGYTHSGLAATGSISPTGAAASPLAQAGGTLALTLTVTSTAEWTLTDDQAWASLDVVTGTGNGSSTLTFSANGAPGSRDVRVSLRRACDSSLLDSELYTQSGTA